MVCGKCARENRPDSRFCAGCGTALTLCCSSCDRELQPDAAFCDGCGTAVAGATPTPTPPAPPAEPTAVRKTVTALFCDLVGSTAFGEKVDPEAARESMNRYFAMARTAIEDNGGVVAKFIGDGVMAMWGVPEVAEDDAERAVRAGLDLQGAFTGIRDFIRDRHGVTVGLRVGINTGEVVISDADDDVVGDALNTAARLEAACTPGRVLVGEPTWRLSRGTVHYTDHGVIQAKGKEEPVASYEVIGLLDVEDPHTETPFVGRDAELRRLQVVMDEAILERTARLVTVIGSPGVGKTRLAREMREAVEGGTRAFELRCEREGMATFAPVADLLRAAAGITDANSVEEMQERLRTLVDPLEDADRVAELLAGFVGAAPMQSTEELFLAVRRLFEVLGATQPVVLIVDDIQWAEPLFLDLLEHLAEWVRDVPLMVVCLARPEIRDVRPPITEPGRRVSAVVALEGLDTEATHELAARLVGADALPADLLAKIPESTQGNPLFVRELMRMLVDDGVIAERDGRWEMVIDVDAVEVPPTVNTLLASRVERLQTDERQALEFASVVGSDFPVGAVAAAAGDSTGLNATFERLRRKELIEPTGTYWGDEPVFRFHHVLIRDAAYRRLLKGNRAELHVTIGDWTERTAANLVGEHEVTIAHHFEQAHQLRLQLGIDDDETDALGTRAAGLLRTAADRALDREDLAAAGPLAARALACIDDDADGLAELLLTACESLLGTGNVAAGVEAVDRLDSVAGDDRRLRAWVECFRAEVAIYTDPGALQGVIESAGRAADVLAELDDQAGVAKARLQRAAALVRLGRVGDCEAELDAALTAARAADDRRRVTAVLGSAPIAALWGPSPVPRAGGRCLDVVRLLRITTGSPAVEATSIRCQAVLESLRGRHDTARTMLENARSTLEEIGHDHGLMETAYFAGLVELLADDPGAAEPHLRRAHDGLGRLGIGADAGQAAAYLARALLLQDRLDEAEDYALRSDALAGQNPQTAIVSRSVQAEILAARGELDEALTLAAEAVHLAAGTDILVDHANAVAAQARVRAAAGDAAGAAEAAATAAALYDEKGATVEVGVVATRTGTVSPLPPDVEDGGLEVELENRCTRAMRALMDQTGDGEATLELFSDRAVVTDHRPVVGGAKHEYGFIEAAVHRYAAAGDATFTLGTLRIVGDDAALFHVRSDFERGDSYAWLVVVLHDESEGFVAASLFGEDDLETAEVELERLTAPLDAPEWMVTFDLMRVAHEHMTAGRVDDWAAMLSDDFAWVEHRQGVRLEAVGRDEARNTLQTILHEPDPDEGPPATPRRADEQPPRLKMTPVDGRGRNLALARVLTTGGGTSQFEREYLLLGQIDDNDLGVLAMAFDVDDVDAATAELGRLWAGADTGAGAGQSIGERAGTKLGQAFEAGSDVGFQAVADSAATDFEISERTRGLQSQPTQAESVVYFADLIDDVAELHFDVIAAKGARLVATRVHWASAGGFETEKFLGIRFNIDGKWERLVWVDTEDEVLGVLDELETDERRSPELRNTATMAYETAGHPVARIEGADFDLFALIDTGAEPPFAVVESSVAGELTIEHFDAIGEAYDRFRVLSAEQMATEADVMPLRSLALALAAKNAAELDRLLAADFTFDGSELPGAFPSMTRDEFIALMASNGAFGIDDRVRKTLGVTDGAYCAWMTQTRDDKEDELDSFHVIGWSEGRVTTHKAYLPDQLDEALAHFDRLASTRTVAEQAFDWIMAGYAESVSEGMRRQGERVGPKHRFDYRMSGLQATPEPEEARANGRWLAENAVGITAEIVASRGEHIIAVSVEWTFQGGFRSPRHVAYQFDADGLIEREVVVDSEADVLAVLDELERELHDPAPTLAEQARDRAIEVMLTDDADSYAELVAPDIRWEDRRGVSRNVLDHDGVLELRPFMVVPAFEMTTIETIGCRYVASLATVAATHGFEERFFIAERYGTDGRWERGICVDSEAEARAALRELFDADLRTPEVANAATRLWETSGRPFVDITAVRDDHVAIVEIDDPDDPFLVVEAAVDGTLSTTAYPSHQDAEVDLMARTLAGRPDIDFTTVVQYAIACTVRDRSELERLLSPSFNSRTASDLALPDSSREEWIEYILTGREFGLEERQRKIFAASGHALCTWSHSRTADVGATYDVIGVIAWDDTGITVNEEYAFDRLDEALARYDEIADSSAPIAERRLRWLMAGYEISAEEGRRREMEIAAPDAVVDDRRAMLALEQTLDQYREVYDEDSERLEALALELLPERGERTFVTRLHGRYVGGFDVLFFVAIRFTDDGQWDAQIYTDTEAEALAALDELAAQRSPIPPPLNTAARVAIARDHALFTEQDEAAWLATLAEDVVADERGSLLPRTLHGRAEVRREYREIVQSTTDFVAETTVLAVAGDHVALCRLRVFESDAPRTDAGVFLDLLNLCETNADGLIQRSVTFHAENLEEAQRDFARWAEPDPPARVPLNTAARAALRNNRALFDQPGEDAWLATFADDVVVEDRQRMAKRTLRGKEEIRGDYVSVSQRATKFGFDIETEVLGVRDDNFAITLMRVFESDADGRSHTDVFLDHVAIYRTNEAGLIDRCAMFDVADENDAWAELARWWAESMDPPERALMLEEVRQGRLFQELRFAEWRAGHHPEYVSTDHRPFGFGTTDTEGMAGRNDALTDDVVGGIVRFPVSENLGLGVRIATIEADLVRKTGAQARIELSYVSIADLVNGGGRWNHQFGLEDFDDARRRGQEMVDQRRKTTALTEAVAVGGLASGRARQSPEHFVEMLHEDFQATLLDGVAIRRDAVASGKVDPAVLGFGHVERSVVSNDGTVGLFRVGAPGGDAWLQLEVVDDLQLRVVEQFPIAELQRAAPAFDERSMTEYDDALQEVGRLGLRFRQAMNRRDVAELDAVISTDFEVVDRRQLMYGSVARDAYLTLMADLGELPDPVLIGEVLTSSERGWLFRGCQAIPGPGGWTENNAGVFVITTAADRIERLECFDEDDLDTAQARFDELSTRAEAHSFGHLAGLEWSERARAGDAQAILELQVTPDLLVAEETWGSTLEMGVEGYEQSLETLLSDVRSLDVTYIGHRGPRMIAAHLVMHTSSAEVRWITVAAYEPSGRFSRLKILTSATEARATMDRWLEEEQRSLDLRNSATMFYEHAGEPYHRVALVRGDHLAVFELDTDAEERFVVVEVDDHGRLEVERFVRLAEASEAASRRYAIPDSPAERAAREYRRAITSRDNGRIERSLAPSYRLESFDVLDLMPTARSELVDYWVNGGELGIAESFPKVFAQTDKGVVVLSRVGQTVENSIDRINVIMGDGTGVTYNGAWPVEMLDEALARFDDLSAGSDSAARTAGARVAAALADRDAGALEACFSDDLVYRNESTLSDLDGDKAQLLENLATMPEYVWETEPVATRDRAEVVHVRGGLPGDYEIEYCLLVTVDEAGLIDRWHVRDMSDLRLALADAGDAQPHDPDLALVVATNRFDHDAHRRAFGSLITHDHRPTSVLDALDVDAWIRVQADTVETHPNTALWFEVRRSSDRALYVEATRWADPADDAPTWNHLCVFGRTAGRFTSLDLFDLSQKAEAVARFEELSTSTVTDIRDVSASIEAALSAGDLDAFAAHFAEDLDFRNESVLSDAGGGKEQMLANIASQGDYTWSGELIVSVGRASVFRLTADLPGDNQLQWCLFATVDDEGLIDRWHVREVEHLRFAMIDATAHQPEATGWGIIDALNRHDDAALAAGLTDDFVNRDHRRGSVLGELDGRGWLDLQAESRGLFPNGAHWCDLLGTRNGVNFADFWRWSDPAEPADWRYLVVITTRGDRVASYDLYSPDQEAEARARFDELAGN